MEYKTEFMKEALRLARKGAGFVHPNPMVGAVVVSPSGEIAGRGYHRRFGAEHAEIAALKEAGARAAGADLYVSLEPCSTHGKTPPCCDAVIRSGIKRVFCAVTDCDKNNSSKAAKIFSNAGVEFFTDMMPQEAKEMNMAYWRYKTFGMPFVTIKLASTFDGKIAASHGDSKWISCQKSRSYVHKLRNVADAVMIGAGTAKKDDPSLCGTKADDNGPVKIVIDGKDPLPCGLKLLNPPLSLKTIIVAAESSGRERIDIYQKNGARVLVCPSSADGRISLSSAMKLIAGQGIIDILCEGGGSLATSLIEERLAGKLLFFMCPKALGEDGISWYKRRQCQSIQKALNMNIVSVKKMDSDIMVEACLLE